MCNDKYTKAVTKSQYNPSLTGKNILLLLSINHSSVKDFGDLLPFVSFLNLSRRSSSAEL